MISFPTGKQDSTGKKLKKKRSRHSSSEEASPKDPKRKPTVLSVDEDPESMEEYLNNPDIDPPPPSKEAKRIP